MKFSEFSPESIERMLNPKRVQLSLFEMQRNRGFTEYFRTPRPAKIITHSSRICMGQLSWTGDSFRFTSQGLSGFIRNRQLLVLAFEINGQDHYTQVTSRDVYHDFFLLGAVPLRYHKRFDLNVQATVIPVSPEDTYEFMNGTLLIRRRKRSTEPQTGIHYFVHERAVQANGDYTTAISESSAPAFAAVLLESSQGGCSLTITSEAAKALHGVKMIYLNTSLTDGRRVGNLAVYGVIRSLRQTAKGVVVRIHYLDTLPLPVEELTGSIKRYGFMFEKRAIAYVNGKKYTAAGLLTVSLPLGRTVFKVDWGGGNITNTQLVVNPLTANILAVSQDFGLSEQVLPKSA